MTPILGILASGISGNLWAPGKDFDSIATTTVGTAVSSITFSSIPSTYRHLQIRGLVRSSRGVSLDSLNVRFNGDTGNNYNIHELTGGGSSAAAQAQVSVSSLYGANTVPTAATTASMFEPFVLDILDYASTTKYKTTRSLNG